MARKTLTFALPQFQVGDRVELVQGYWEGNRLFFYLAHVKACVRYWREVGERGDRRLPSHIKTELRETFARMRRAKHAIVVGIEPEAGQHGGAMHANRCYLDGSYSNIHYHYKLLFDWQMRTQQGLNHVCAITVCPVASEDMLVKPAPWAEGVTGA